VQIVLVAIAVVLILVGVAFTLSPIPFGAFIVVAGASMLVAVSPVVRAFLRLERRRHPHFDKMLGLAEEKVPHSIAAPLERTDGPEARRLHEEHARQRQADPARARRAEQAREQSAPDSGS